MTWVTRLGRACRSICSPSNTRAWLTLEGRSLTQACVSKQRTDYCRAHQGPDRERLASGAMNEVNAHEDDERSAHHASGVGSNELARTNDRIVPKTRESS